VGAAGAAALAPRPRVGVGETDKVDEHESGQPGETGENECHGTLIRHQKQHSEHCEQDDVGHKDHPKPEQCADRAVPHSLSMADQVHSLVVTVTTCDGPIYLPALVLRPSAKLHRRSKKTIVPKMASVITSATVSVSTMSTANASRPRPLAPTNRQSFNL